MAESDLKRIQEDFGDLARAVQELAKVVEDMTRGRSKTSAAVSANNAGHLASRIADKYS